MEARELGEACSRVVELESGRFGPKGKTAPGSQSRYKHWATQSREEGDSPRMNRRKGAEPDGTAPLASRGTPGEKVGGGINPNRMPPRREKMMHLRENFIRSDRSGARRCGREREPEPIRRSELELFTERIYLTLTQFSLGGQSPQLFSGAGIARMHPAMSSGGSARGEARGRVVGFRTARSDGAGVPLQIRA